MAPPRSGDPVRRKLALLQLAEELGNVSEACRIAGYSRQQFYEIREAYRLQGAEGLVDRRPGPKGPHPNRVGAGIEAAVLAWALEHPAHGARRVSEGLRGRGLDVGSGGVRGVWERHGLGTRSLRARRLKETARDRRLVLDDEQIRALEWADPEFRDRHVEVPGPGRRIAVDVFVVPGGGEGGRAQLHVALDCFSRFAWARLYRDRRPATAADLLADEVLPFMGSHRIPVWTVVTDGTPAFRGGRDTHPFAALLAREEIEHRVEPRDGFVERFRDIVEEEYLRRLGAHPRDGTLEAMREALADWLRSYNRFRPHDGRGMGGRVPFAVFRAGLADARRAAGRPAAPDPPPGGTGAS